MPHPKKKTTKAARNQRRSHHALKEVTLTTCKKCNKPIKPHHACASCGYYKGKEVLNVTKKLPKKERIKIKKKKTEDRKKEENRKKIDKS